MASARAVEPMLSRMRSVAMALMEGSSDVRTIPQTMVGNVLPLPIVKKVMTKSSSEIASAINPAPMTVGWMMGSVMVKNAPHEDAPRSRADSTSDQSKVESLAKTMATTKGTTMTRWLKITVGRPKGILRKRTK